MKIETVYTYRLLHPVTLRYIEIVITDKESYKDWKPYLDTVEKWFLNLQAPLV